MKGTQASKTLSILLYVPPYFLMLWDQTSTIIRSDTAKQIASHTTLSDTAHLQAGEEGHSVLVGHQAVARKAPAQEEAQRAAAVDAGCKMYTVHKHIDVDQRWITSMSFHL